MPADSPLSLSADTLIADGAEPLKALADAAAGTRRVGAYAVRFSSPDEKDLSGEYFTGKTDFGPTYGALVGTNILTGSIIELLRNKPLVSTMGAMTLTGLVGNVAIPRINGGATAYWLNEQGPATNSDQAFGQIGFMPKRLVGRTGYTKELINQTDMTPAAPSPCLIVDLNHNNTSAHGGAIQLDLQRLWDAGVRVLFHKATQGARFKDPLYHARKAAALAFGFRWGAYHFSSGHPIADQIANFFSMEDGSDHAIAYALDWEDSTDGTDDMTRTQAVAFVQALIERTGAPGFVYGSNLPRERTGTVVDPVLSQTELWKAGNGPVPPTWAKKGVTIYQTADTLFAGIEGCDKDRPGMADADFLTRFPFRG